MKQNPSRRTDTADVFIVDVEHPDLDVPKSGCIHPDLDVYGLKHPDDQKLTRI